MRDSGQSTLTDLKSPLSGDAWRENVHRAIETFRNNRHFLFSAYPDADALGTMLALALYLRRLDKRATLFLPSPFKRNLQFMKEIIQYNGIPLVTHEEELTALQGQVDTVVFCDTAHARLVPLFSILNRCFLDAGVPAVEIDHHFGTDSAAITESGIHLFRRANASTEIAAELLQGWHQLDPELPAPFEQRNIVISLLLGLLTDTFGGRALPLPEDYNHWHAVLGGSLKDETRSIDGSDKNSNAVLFRSPGEILNHLNWLDPVQERRVEILKKKIDCHQGIGELNLLDSALTQLFTESIKSSNGEFFQVWNTMANVVPQVGGKIGLFYFNGKNAEGQDCIFLKIRRAFDFDGYDLRDSGAALQNIFGPALIGGGGHAGAVSFRIRPMEDRKFLDRISGLITFLQQKIQ